MALIEKIKNFVKKKYNLLSIVSSKSFQIKNYNSIFLISMTIFSVVFVISSNFINKKNEEKKNNFKEITETNEFSNLAHFFISKINSPYEEIEYIIKKNDTVEKILKQYKVKDKDIKNISLKLKEKKLTNIYSARKLSIVLKKLEDGSKTIVNFLYPINNTTSVEVRKVRDNFIVKENILQLYKKEVVVKKVISNNLYSSAVSSGVEPNIIVEFARIFGFEVDFQRDIRKGDWFEIL